MKCNLCKYIAQGKNEYYCTKAGAEVNESILFKDYDCMIHDANIKEKIVINEDGCKEIEIEGMG